MNRILTALLFTLTLASTANAQNSKEQPVCSSQVISTSSTEPANLHSVYSSIEDTQVTLQDFSLRLNDGSVVNVATEPMQVDLQDLQGLGRGLLLNLRGVQLPGGSASVVSIQMKVGTSAQLVSSGSSLCALGTYPTVNLYTSAPITVVADEQYLVKVAFAPIRDILIESLTQTIQTKCCTGKKCSTTTETSGPEMSCSMASRKYPITTIIRPSDEF